MADRVPARLTWAVEQLALAGHERVLEIGGGTGVAAALMLDRLPNGFLLGIDRSDGAVAKAAARNTDAVAAGRAAFQVSCLADLHVSSPFDIAVAVNVNVFWTGDAERECDALVAALRPGGAVHLVFETPGPVGDHVLRRTATNLTREGFSARAVHSGSPNLAGVIGHLDA